MGLRVGFGGVVAFCRFDDQAATDRFGRHIDSHDLSVDDGANTLHVRFKGASCAGGDSSTDTTEMFCFTTSADASSSSGPFSSHGAYARHSNLLIS